MLVLEAEVEAGEGRYRRTGREEAPIGIESEDWFKRQGGGG